MTIWKRPISVLVVIHTPELDVLLLERAAHPGFWQSVTGSLEEGESLRETAAREVREETGIDYDPGRYSDWAMSNRFEIFSEWRHRYAPGVTHNIEHVFSLCLSQPVAVTPSPSEHRNWQWLPWKTAAELCFSWTNRDAILMLSAREFSST